MVGTEQGISNDNEVLTSSSQGMYFPAFGKERSRKRLEEFIRHTTGQFMLSIEIPASQK